MRCQATFEWWLDNCQVSHISQSDDNGWWPESMPYAVTHPNKGIVALFTNERDALRHRLSIINDALNPPTLEGGE